MNGDENVLDFLKKVEVDVPEKGMVIYSDKKSEFTLLEEGNKRLYQDTICQEDMSKEMFILVMLTSFYFLKVKKTTRVFGRFVDSALGVAVDLLKNPKLKEENEYDFTMSENLEILPNSLRFYKERNMIFNGKETFTLSKERPVQDFVDSILNGDFDLFSLRAMLLLDFLIGSNILLTLYLSEKGFEGMEDMEENEILGVAKDLSEKLNKKNEYFNKIISKNQENPEVLNIKADIITRL